MIVVLLILFYLFMAAFTFQFVIKKDIGITHYDSDSISDDRGGAIFFSISWPFFYIFYYSSVIAKDLLKDKEEK